MTKKWIVTGVGDKEPIAMLNYIVSKIYNTVQFFKAKVSYIQCMSFVYNVYHIYWRSHTSTEHHEKCPGLGLASG